MTRIRKQARRFALAAARSVRAVRPSRPRVLVSALLGEYIHLLLCIRSCRTFWTPRGLIPAISTSSLSVTT